MHFVIYTKIKQKVEPFSVPGVEDHVLCAECHPR